MDISRFTDNLQKIKFCSETISNIMPFLVKHGVKGEIEAVFKNSPASIEIGYINFVLAVLDVFIHGKFNFEIYTDMNDCLSRYYGSFTRNVMIKALSLLGNNADLIKLGENVSKIVSPIEIYIPVDYNYMKIGTLFGAILEKTQWSFIISALEIITPLAIKESLEIYQRFLNKEFSIIRCQQAPGKVDRYAYFAPMINKLSTMEHYLEISHIIDLSVVCDKMTAAEFVENRIVELKKDYQFEGFELGYINDYISFLEDLLVVNNKKAKYLLYSKKKMTIYKNAN